MTAVVQSKRLTAPYIQRMTLRPLYEEKYQIISKTTHMNLSNLSNPYTAEPQFS